MLFEPSALVILTTTVVLGFEASWIYWLVRVDSPRRYRKTLNDILDERFPQTKGMMKGGMDPRALVESREEKRTRTLGEMFSWLQQRVGAEAAPVYWQMIPPDLKRTMSNSASTAWGGVLKNFLSNAAVKPKEAPEQKNPYMGT